MGIFNSYENFDRTGDDQLICLKDRFNWFAFLLPPIWAISARLWRVLLYMILGLVAFALLAQVFVLPGFALYFLAVIWLGFEANSLTGTKLRRSGWNEGAPIMAPNLIQAERRYFSRQRRRYYSQQKRNSE